MLRFLFGDAKWVAASPAPVFGDKDPTLSGQILFENGILTSLCGMNVQDYLIFEMDLYGSKGRLRITHSGFDADLWKVGKGSYFSGYKELLPAKADFKLNKKQMMINAMTDLVKCVRTGKSPSCDGEDGVKALELICAFHESVRAGKRVELPLKNRKVKI